MNIKINDNNCLDIRTPIHIFDYVSKKDFRWKASNFIRRGLEFIRHDLLHESFGPPNFHASALPRIQSTCHVRQIVFSRGYLNYVIVGGVEWIYRADWYSPVARQAGKWIEHAEELRNQWLSNISKSKMPGGGYRWVRYSGGRYVLPGMVTVGRDLDGSCLVVGRAHHHGDILPAKAKPEHGVAYISYGGTEIMKHDFEVLMPVEFRWVPSRNGHIPSGAVDGGRTSSGEPLYVGRTIHNGVPCVGKVHPSHGSLYIPFNGQEIPFREYEVLVQQ